MFAYDHNHVAVLDFNVAVLVCGRFGRHSLKTPIHDPKLGSWGYFTPKMSNINETFERHILARVCVV